MGRQKNRSVLSLSQNHKRFKQRVHLSNSALSRHASKCREEVDPDAASFISKQTTNSVTFAPNLIECLLFPILQSSTQTQRRQLHRADSSKLPAADPGAVQLSAHNFSLHGSVFMSTIGPRRLTESSDHFIDWQSALLVDTTHASLSHYISYQRDADDMLVEDDFYLPNAIQQNWPCDMNGDGDEDEDIDLVASSSRYDHLMLRCGQHTFGELVCRRLSFADFAGFIEHRFGYPFWAYHGDGNACAANKRLLAVYRSINADIEQCYAQFVQSEVAFGALCVMGNRHIDARQRSSHVSSRSLYVIERSLQQVRDSIATLDLTRVHVLTDTCVLQWMQRIRESQQNVERVLRDARHLQFEIVQHLQAFPAAFVKSLTRIAQRLQHETPFKPLLQQQQQQQDVSLIYVYNKRGVSSFEVHIDLELCDFASLLNYYRYLLTVLHELTAVALEKHEPQLERLLKHVGGEIEGSIWSRQIWQEREHPRRLQKDEQLCKRLLFVTAASHAQEVDSMKAWFAADELAFLSDSALRQICEIQRSFRKHVQQMLNSDEVNLATLAVHIKLNLLNSDEYVRSQLLPALHDIVHDRDRPRGLKPTKSLEKLRENARLLLEKRAKKKKKIRIQTSERYLSKLANIVPSAQDIQQQYHNAILKQRAQKRQFLLAQKRKREQEVAEMRTRKRQESQSTQLPALESIAADEPPMQKVRKSQRIEDAGGARRPFYAEPEVEEFVQYQFEFAIVNEWSEFLSAALLQLQQELPLSEVKQRLELVLVGVHCDVEDEYHDWYHGIIDRVRVSAKKTVDCTSDADECKTQSQQQQPQGDTHNNNNNINLFNKYDFKFRIHFKNFSKFWNIWLELPSARIAPLRTYSNAYDCSDDVKPLAEVLRELDESHAMSIDGIAEALSLDKHKFLQWINTQNDDEINATQVLRWTKHFLTANRTQHMQTRMMISRDYFVKAGAAGKRSQHIICDAVLPSTLNVQLQTIDATQQRRIERKAIENLEQQKCDYFTMSEQCGIPLPLFQQIVFGITDLLPQFIIDRILNWAQDIHLQNLDLAIKEEQLFYVKIE